MYHNALLMTAVIAFGGFPCSDSFMLAELSMSTTGLTYFSACASLRRLEAAMMAAAVSRAMLVLGALSLVAMQEKMASEPLRHSARVCGSAKEPSMIVVSERIESSGRSSKSFALERTNRRRERQGVDRI